MKIAIFHNLPSGGAKRHTLEQVRELAHRGHELVEFTLSTADLSYCSLAPYVRDQRIYPFAPARPIRRRVPLLTPYFHAWTGLHTLRGLNDVNRQVASEIDSRGFDCVLVKDCHLAMNPYVLRHLTTPSAFQCHHGLRHWLTGSPGQLKTLDRLKHLYFRPAQLAFDGRLHFDERTNARRATLALTNSKYSQSLMAERYGVSARIIYPGINIGKFRPLGIERQDYVLSVGALIYGKGHRFLISALSRIAAARRPSLFIAANSADSIEEAFIRKLAEEHGVNLHIEQIVDDARLVQVYNQARAFIYAPYQEALGMAPLEALACGTPVVAVAEGGVRETVIDDETGWLTERDEQIFAERLESLLADDAARDRMGRTGIARVRETWNWDRAVDELESSLEECRSGASGR